MTLYDVFVRAIPWFCPSSLDFNMAHSENTNQMAYFIGKTIYSQAIAINIWLTVFLHNNINPLMQPDETTLADKDIRPNQR